MADTFRQRTEKWAVICVKEQIERFARLAKESDDPLSAYSEAWLNRITDTVNSYWQQLYEDLAGAHQSISILKSPDSLAPPEWHPGARWPWTTLDTKLADSLMKSMGDSCVTLLRNGIVLKEVKPFKLGTCPAESTIGPATVEDDRRCGRVPRTVEF